MEQRLGLDVLEPTASAMVVDAMGDFVQVVLQQQVGNSTNLRNFYAAGINAVTASSGFMDVPESSSVAEKLVPELVSSIPKWTLTGDLYEGEGNSRCGGQA